MNVSSRTPEGTPHECPLCGAISNLEPAFPGGDAVCPACGQLVWWFRDRYGERLAGVLESLSLDGTWNELGLDSLDVVELAMELEEEFDLDIPREDLERLKTLADLIRYLRQHDDLLPPD
jgi:acyl carrier protein